MAFSDSIISILLLWAPLMLCWVVGFQVQRLYIHFLQRVGGKALLYVPAFFCVPVHELSHYVVAKLCGHKVISLALFRPNPSGTLGCVEHAYRSTLFSPFSNMLIGLAPVFGAMLVITLTTNWFFPEFALLRAAANDLSIKGVFYGFVDSATNILSVVSEPRGILWLLIVSNIAVFGLPSASDFKGAGKGVLIVVSCYLMTVVFSGSQSIIHQWVLKIAFFSMPILLLSILSTLAVVIPLTAIAFVKERAI